MEPSYKIQFTKRELQIIKLILLCKPRKAIPELLGMSTDTLKTHIKLIFLKTGEHSISQLIVHLLSTDFKVNEERTEVTYLGKVL